MYIDILGYFFFKKQLFQIKTTNQKKLAIIKTNIVNLILYDLFYLTILMLYSYCYIYEVNKIISEKNFFKDLNIQSNKLIIFKGL